jgi:hypothetical protein
MEAHLNLLSLLQPSVTVAWQRFPTAYFPLPLGSRNVPFLSYSNSRLTDWVFLDMSCLKHLGTHSVWNTTDSHYCCIQLLPWKHACFRSHYSVTAVSAAFTALALRIHATILSCLWSLLCLSEDGDSMFLRNVDTCAPSCTALRLNSIG